MSVAEETKIALDESRTLMLGSQILFGFQLQASFQNAFETLTAVERFIELALVPLMVCVIGLLIAPSARHRIVERGYASRELNAFITRMMRVVIPLFALALALDLFIAGTRIAGMAVGVVTAAMVLILTLFVCGSFSTRLPERSSPMTKPQPTPLDQRIQYVLTEARVILPGAQAILGFQLVIVLTQAFAELPDRERLVHGIAIAFVTISTALLMAPAARHRLIHHGRNSQAFCRSASHYLLLATLMLALGIALDVEVIAMKIARDVLVAISLAVLCGAMLLALWYVWPLADVKWRLSRETW
jgi:hypothetical protein